MQHVGQPKLAHRSQVTIYNLYHAGSWGARLLNSERRELAIAPLEKEKKAPTDTILVEVLPGDADWDEAVRMADQGRFICDEKRLRPGRSRAHGMATAPTTTPECTSRSSPPSMGRSMPGRPLTSFCAAVPAAQHAHGRGTCHSRQSVSAGALLSIDS